MELHVFRESDGGFERIGTLSYFDGPTTFRYAEEYLRAGGLPISCSLPLTDAPIPTLFFEGLLPEEGMRKLFDQAAHTDGLPAETLLARLNYESTGALLFCEDPFFPVDSHGYEPVSDSLIGEFARRPRGVALETGMARRLSLAGAQAKLGLAWLNGSWFIPMGSSPTTHILKASDGTFENITVNECLCMRTLAELDIDVARVELIPVAGEEPVIAVERFDRVLDDGSDVVRRIHQEDFYQADADLQGAGFRPAQFKYEPTDGAYAARCSRIISKESANPFEDRLRFFEMLLASYYLGNCDNHLKNHSLLWSEDWSVKRLSPAYDVVCTTIYEQLDREMGIGLCRSRRIDDVTTDSILATAKGISIPSRVAAATLDSVKGEAADALLRAKDKLVQEHAGDDDIVRRVNEVYLQVSFQMRERL